MIHPDIRKRRAQKVNRQHMHKQEPSKSISGEHGPGNTPKDDRYYVQRISEQIFVIRERPSVEKDPGPDDRIVRSFVIGHDASLYADSINALQKKLDEEYGHWTKNATEDR